MLDLLITLAGSVVLAVLFAKALLFAASLGGFGAEVVIDALSDLLRGRVMRV